MCLDHLMAREDLGQTFLLTLYENTVDDNVQDFDKYEIGNNVGLLDKLQTDNLVKELVERGYIMKSKEKSKIYLSNKGKEKVEL
jgi:hypothetical protein